jgi:hypothetical protein
VKEELMLTQAELISFCRDFGFALVKKKIMDIFKELEKSLSILKSTERILNF